MSGFDDDFGEMVESKAEANLMETDLIGDSEVEVEKVEDTTGDDSGEVEEDPAAEFLSREQAQLGTIDSELGAALSDDLGVTLSPSSVTDSSKPVSTVKPITSLPTIKKVKEEPAVLREWRERQMARLCEKDKQEEEDRQKLKENAAKELEDWYKLHDDTMEKTRAANREARLSEDRTYVSEFSETMEPGTEWERVAKLCDFNQKTCKTVKDVSRMRSIILQLKSQSGTAVAS